MELTQNNISTIATMLFPLASYVCTALFGVTLDQVMFVMGFSAIVELILLFWSAKNPNTMSVFGNDTEPVEYDDGVLNQEYIAGDDDGC